MATKLKEEEYRDITRKQHIEDLKQEAEFKQAQREQLVNEQRNYAVALTN